MARARGMARALARGMARALARVGRRAQAVWGLWVLGPLAGVAVWAAPSRGSPTRNMAAMSNVEMVRRMVFLISKWVHIWLA